MLSHRLSALQGSFINEWTRSQTESHGIVIVGTSLGDLLFYKGDIVTSLDINYIKWPERKHGSFMHVPLLIGKKIVESSMSGIVKESVEKIRKGMINV